jgi:hypothetical protein
VRQAQAIGLFIRIEMIFDIGTVIYFNKSLKIICNFLRRLVLYMHVAVKGRKVSDGETVHALQAF